MLSFRKFLDLKSKIPEFDHYASKSNEPKTPKDPNKKVSRKIPDFDHYDFKSNEVKESLLEGRDWSEITKPIFDHSVKSLNIDPNKSEHTTDDVPGIRSERWEERRKVQPLLDKLINHHNNFSNSNKYTIKKYTDSSFFFNKYLHDKANNKLDNEYNPTRPEDHEEFHKALTSVARRHGGYPEGFFVNSGIGTSLDMDPTKAIRDNGVTKHNIWISGSPNMAVAKDFSREDKHGHRNISRIYVPPRTAGDSTHLPVSYIGHHSELSSEDEALIPPGHIIYHPHPTVIKHGKATYHMYHGMYVDKNMAEKIHSKIGQIKA